MMKKQKKAKWFVSIRGSYLPNSGAGWLTYIPFLAFLIAVPILAFSSTDSFALAVLLTVPNWVAAAIVMTYVASRRS